jgi:hypothetical protein
MDDGVIVRGVTMVAVLFCVVLFEVLSSGGVGHRWCTGAQVVHKWCTGGAQVVHRWCTGGAQMVHRWCTDGTHVVHTSEITFRDFNNFFHPHITRTYLSHAYVHDSINYVLLRVYPYFDSLPVDTCKS